MPRYSSRSRSRKVREKKRIRAQVPRDRRKLSHWAVRGTHKDMQKLSAHAHKHADQRPSYVTDRALELMQNPSRRKLIEAAHEHDNHWFTDGLAWLLDKVPGGNGFGWLKGMGQAALKPFRGDHLSEVDEQYARLVNEAYTDVAERDDQFEHWDRQKEFDSEYLTVYDNEDGHRFVAVRGTKMNAKDLGEDALIGIAGRPRNLIGEALRKVLDNTEPGRTVDVGGHSLGTSLILTAFDNDDSLQSRVHQTYLYNPAMSPFAKNVTQDFEGDDRVRYFIDLLDPVSVGDLGQKGPKNVVYRTSYHNPLHSHQLTQWGGPDGGLQEHDDAELEKEHLLHHKEEAELPYDTTGDGVPNAPEPAQQSETVGDEFSLDFGNDFDSGAWKVYWNQ
jgi:hypothetical protein